ncbi:phage holin family protein [Arsenicicoccus sp. UBA7492]|uniref:phage holin family protein n=1 Tax=Arsenicicoccus sp. UBA7492 TaxID=1946057 RepID=UPI00257E3E5A|nr:phage holin family protein [Arsenicicoccus sp. UBA7492]
MTQFDNSHGATAAGADPSPREPLAPGDVRPAEPLEGSHQTYEKGELSAVGALLGDIANDMTTLLRQEAALAKLEVQQSAKSAGKGVGLLGGAGVAGHFVLLFLSIALWWGLGTAMDNHVLSALIVAAIWAVIAAVLASMGRKDLKNVNGAPRTIETAKQVPDALKGNENRA